MDEDRADKIGRIAIVGVGRAGGALALAMAKAGLNVTTLVVRERRTAELVAGIISPAPQVLTRSEFPSSTSDVIIIATRDDEIGSTAAWLADKTGDSRPVVLHLSGAAPSAVLEPLRSVGCANGSFHPLISLNDAVSGSALFDGAFFGLEGDERAVATGRLIAAALNGRTLAVTADSKPLYHAAAVNACGNLVALVDASLEMLGACGIQSDDARAALIPLIESTVANLKRVSPPNALTGPFVRADVGTVKLHLARIAADTSAGTLAVYCELGLRSLDLAAESGGDPERIEAIRNEILLAKSRAEC